MQITQTGKKIVADFTDLENQYSHNTIEIHIVKTDNTFDNYTMFASLKIDTFATYLAQLPVENDKIILPNTATYFAGVMTISLYGTKTEGGQDYVITTDTVTLNIVASNPTGQQAEPISTNWIELMNRYVQQSMQRFAETTAPSLSTQNTWKIGQLDTGIKAEGDRITINPSDKHWYINGEDTGVVSEGHADVTPATKSVLGGVIVGDGLNVELNGKISVIKKIELTKTLTSTNWNQHIYDLAIPEVKANSIIEILPIAVTRPTPTQTELENNEILNGLGLQDAGQTDGHIYLYASEIPTKNVQIRLIIEG